MKRWSKILIASLICVLFITLGSVAAFAEEPAVEDTVEAPTLDDIEFVFKYTSDSVVTEGLTYQTYTDPISNQSGVELVPNFGLGYAIYDDPETEIIDGIRINGTEVSSLRIPMSAETTVFRYEVAVRTVYVEGASGDLAQILDGTYDYTQLLTNPVIIFQLAYWVFMALAGFIGLVTVIRNKGVKVKTSDEIASKVTENVGDFRQQIIDIVTDTVKAEILPLAQASVKSGKEAVKAIVLSTSKSKDAPSALLDVFKESSDIDIASIVDEVKEELSKAAASNTSKHAANAEALHAIANHVIQEDVSNAKSNPSTEFVKTQKSIF